MTTGYQYYLPFNFFNGYKITSLLFSSTSPRQMSLIFSRMRAGAAGEYNERGPRFLAVVSIRPASYQQILYLFLSRSSLCVVCL
jgi:hypothetical protein